MFEALGDVSLDLLRGFRGCGPIAQFYRCSRSSWAPRNRPISQQIKRLEEQLATRLFDRIYRGIELTDAGMILVQSCSAGLHRWMPD
jgi:hypothetical protein